MFDRRLLPIGIDDFGKLRESGLFYIDKTRFIQQLIDRKGIEVFLFPRPRRFGKTLAMTMLKSFFEKTKEPRSAWFEGLEIWNAGPAYREHFQRYPLIYMTLKDVKENSADAFFKKNLFKAVLTGILRISKENIFSDSNNLRGCPTGRNEGFIARETDGAVHCTVTEVDRRYETRSSPVGCPLSVYSILRPDYSDAFGFTESEVSGMLEQAGMLDKLGEVRDWYNGYLFGGRVMYNPWSLLNYVADGGVPRTYWVNTSANSLIKQILIQHAGRLGDEMEVLLSGGEVARTLEENTALGDLSGDVNVLYSLLTFAGYLKARALPSEYNDRYALSIPNREVHAVYRGTFSGWLSAGLSKGGLSLEDLHQALLLGDAEGLEDALTDLAGTMLSYQDGTSKRPEFFYHGFVLGLLSTLEPAYRVRSNRESGDGRPDVLVIPADKGKAGVVLELKVAKPKRKTLEQALDEGEAQMKGKNDAAELQAQGVGSLIALVVAFDGKTVRVRRVEMG